MCNRDGFARAGTPKKLSSVELTVTLDSDFLPGGMTEDGFERLLENIEESFRYSDLSYKGNNIGLNTNISLRIDVAPEAVTLNIIRAYTDQVFGSVTIDMTKLPVNDLAAFGESFRCADNTENTYELCNRRAALMNPILDAMQKAGLGFDREHSLVGFDRVFDLWYSVTFSTGGAPQNNVNLTPV